jgi:hypothetical protein
MKISFIALLVLAQICFVEATSIEEPEEGVTYAYPFTYDEETVTDDKSHQDSSKAKSKKDHPPAWQGKIGAADVTVDVLNTDFLSQYRAKWDKTQNKSKKKKEKSRFKKDEEDEEDSHMPIVKFHAEWK